MSENTKIEWATHTFNPWEGCQKVGPGCDNCYAEARNSRYAGGTAINWGPGAPRRRTSEGNWRKPLAWNANHEAFFKEHGHRQRVFCASLADVFDNSVDPQWLVDLFALIESTPNLDWLLLTKRIGNVLTMVRDGKFFPAHWPNVWIGATICNQEEADRDIPKLLAVPAAKRFLSMEPLLGPVNLGAWIEPWNECGYCGESFDFEQDRADLCPGCGQTGCMCTGFGSKLRSEFDNADGRLEVPDGPGIDWVIVGGESGHNARPMHPDWARSLRDQCVSAGAPYLFKQWGEWFPCDQWSFHVRMSKQCAIKADGSTVSNDDAPQDVGGQRFQMVGKKLAGRLLDGRTWDEVPA